MNVLLEKVVELKAIEEVTNNGNRPDLEGLHRQRGRIDGLLGVCHDPIVVVYVYKINDAQIPSMTYRAPIDISREKHDL